MTEISVANRENTEKHKQKMVIIFFYVTYLILHLFGLVMDYNFVFYLRKQVSFLQYLKNIKNKFWDWLIEEHLKGLILVQIGKF